MGARAEAGMNARWLGVRGGWALALIFAIAGIVDVASARHLHDEGLLTFYFARMTADDPIAAFFLQKTRPPISALYAPIAAIGPLAFGIAHVLVAALAIPALCGLAKSCGQRWPALAGLLLATSPLYFAAAAAGVSNSDGVAFACVASWLWLARGRGFAGGVLLGMLPWIRAELAPLSLALLVVAALRRERAPWLGALVFPLGYCIAGAVVHGDVLWMGHHPPALPEPMPGNPYWATHDGRIGAADLLASLLALGPLCILAPTLVPRRLHTAELAWIAFALFELGVLLALPRWRAFNFDLSPRYLLGVVPALALAGARAIAALDEPASPRRRAWELAVLVGFAILSWRAVTEGAHAAGLTAVAIAATAVACARAGRARIGVAIAVSLACIGPFGFDDGARLRRDREAPELDEIVARLAEHPDWRTRPIYTNAPLLAAHLQRVDPERATVHYIVQADQLHELVALANPEWGQRERLFATIDEEFYGVPVLPDGLTPGKLPRDALLVLVDDPRLELVLPSARWEPWLELEVASLRVRIAEIREESRP
ncbi:MAG TPA: hypothetical protein VG755_13815 [Nannocystaceae bacterium]|nr:hypothetical protein [Nannocystaceae bacterium]